MTGTEYLIADHLGSTRLSMNNQLQVVRRYDFLPFGEEIVAGVGGRGADYEPSSYVYPTTPDDVLHKFTSKERDAETGLDYFGARYFSGAQGRFISADWSAAPEPVPYADLNDPQTLNLFGYVRNSPLTKADPEGHAGAGAVDQAIKFYIVRIEAAAATAGVSAVSGLASVVRVGAGIAGLFFSAAVMPGNHEDAVLHKIHNGVKSNQQQNKQNALDNEKEMSPEKEAQVQAGSSGQGGKKGTRPPNAKQGVEDTQDKEASIKAEQAGYRKQYKPDMINDATKSEQDAKNALEKARKEHNALQPSQ